MKLLRFLLLVGLVAAMLVPALMAQEKVITWATNPQYPPYDWVNADGTYDGAAAELVTLLTPKGYTLEPVLVPWKRAQELAKVGKLDLLVNFRITPEREEWLQFSTNPTFPNPVAVFVRDDKKLSLISWDVLKPLTGGVSLGDTFGNGFDAYLKQNLSYSVAPSMIENFKMLDAGRIDWFVSGANMGLAWLSISKLAHPIVALTPYISNDSIHLGMSRLSPHLGVLAEIDKKLAQLKADGTLDRLLQKYQKRFTSAPGTVFP
ncbi:MAG: transporter substrate-binding domain-containing protein [Spirochaetales bacterium]